MMRGRGGFIAHLKGRAEHRGISDTRGGLLVDFRLIWMQTLSAVALAALSIGYTVFFAYTWPDSMWWAILTTAYIASGLSFWPWLWNRWVRGWARGSFRIGRVSASWESISVALMMALGAVHVAVFYLYLWDPLEDWTGRFFDVRVPVIDGWFLAALVSTFLSIEWRQLGGAAVVERKKYWVLRVIGLVCAGVFWYTAEWVRPSLEVYIAMTVGLVALWSGTGVSWWRFVREVNDAYEPDREEPVTYTPEEIAGRTSIDSPRRGGGDVLEY